MGDVALVERFLVHVGSSAVVDVNHKDDAGDTPLGRAIQADDVPMAALFIREGADVDLPCPDSVCDRSHRYAMALTPLFMAMNVAMTAASEPEPKARDMGMIELLLTAGASHQCAPYVNGRVRRALEEACKQGVLPLVEMLVRFGADIHAAYSDTYLLMEYPASRGHTDVVLYLISHRADWRVGSDRQNAVQAAMEGGHFELVVRMREALYARIRRRAAARVITSALKANADVGRVRRRAHLACVSVLRSAPQFRKGGLSGSVAEALADQLEALHRRSASVAASRSVAWNGLPVFGPLA